MVRKILNFLRKTKYQKINIIVHLVHLCITFFWYKWFFKKIGTKSVIRNPILLTPSCIEIGSNVGIRDNARIEGVFEYSNVSFSPLIIIGNNVRVEQGLHLTCAEKITIGNNSSLASNVTVTDINHSYLDVTIPIEQQKIEVSPVIIGEDCKIYNNVVILPGVTIGKHCVVGANSVVAKDIPDYSIAVGAPALVIKRYDFNSQTWRKVNKEGFFL